MLIDLTKNDFDTTISQNKLTVVYFWAEWCGPCRHFAPIFKKVESLYPDVVFAKVNIEHEQILAKDFNILSIPHVMVFRGNIAIYSESGSLGVQELVALIDQGLSLNISEIEDEIDKFQSSKE